MQCETLRIYKIQYNCRWQQAGQQAVCDFETVCPKLGFGVQRQIFSGNFCRDQECLIVATMGFVVGVIRQLQTAIGVNLPMSDPFDTGQPEPMFVPCSFMSVWNEYLCCDGSGGEKCLLPLSDPINFLLAERKGPESFMLWSSDCNPAYARMVGRIAESHRDTVLSLAQLHFAQQEERAKAKLKEIESIPDEAALQEDGDDLRIFLQALMLRTLTHRKQFLRL